MAWRNIAVVDFSVITLKPASAKQGGRIGLYYIGNWPSTRGKNVKARYDAPSGFIEVTRDKQDTELSDHFELRDFFPHDQQNVWPKYIVVDMKLNTSLPSRILNGTATLSVAIGVTRAGTG